MRKGSQTTSEFVSIPIPAIPMHRSIRSSRSSVKAAVNKGLALLPPWQISAATLLTAGSRMQDLETSNHTETTRQRRVGISDPAAERTS